MLASDAPLTLSQKAKPNIANLQNFKSNFMHAYSSLSLSGAGILNGISQNLATNL